MKQSSVFFPEAVRQRVQHNATAADRAQAIAAAAPWAKLSDAELRALMFGNTIKRSWFVWSSGYCPACKGDATMFAWQIDALKHPWKVQCPHCNELFPKNDFAAYYRSGLDADGIFQPARADRSLLGPDADDGEGYVEGDKRWRFIGYYLIRGQWTQLVLDGLRQLANAYIITGDRSYGHKAGILLDRVAELHPTFDFQREGVMYEKGGDRGYVSTWHHACIEARVLAMTYDQIFDCLDAAQRQKIEERILREVLAHREKIESNYPSTDVTTMLMHIILGWPGNRDEVLAMLDPVLRKATTVDGQTGEKGITGYTCTAPSTLGLLFSFLMLLEGDLLGELLRRHPRLHQLYRFHIDTWCLHKYYPQVGDCGYEFGEPTERYPAVPWEDAFEFTPKAYNPNLKPSMYAFFWRLYELTGDVAFVQVLHHANGGTVAGLPHDLFTSAPSAFQRNVQQVIDREGTEIKLGSVNKTEWQLAILRSGKGENARAVWIDYDAGGAHGHSDAMNIGLFARGLPLIADNGYPPVHKGGWGTPTFLWYPMTAAHNTVVVDRRSQPSLTGRTTLWKQEKDFQAISVETVPEPVVLNGGQFGFYLCTRGQIGRVRCGSFADDFRRTELGTDWKVLDGEWRIENGWLTGQGTILCTRKLPGTQRLEYDAVSDEAQPCDLSAFLGAGEAGMTTGALFGFGSKQNMVAMIVMYWGKSRFPESSQVSAQIVPGYVHHVVCELDGQNLRHWVDGKLIQSCVNDGFPYLPGTGRKRYARTLAVVDVSEKDFYLFDLFHVVGGSEHCKFQHARYGAVTTEGLTLRPGADFGHGTLMRNFRYDPAPASGWSVDWKIQDVNLRYTDLTEGAEAHLCEGWISVHGYKSHEEAWIPRVMVRRQASESLFVAVIEPYEGQSNLWHIRRHGERLEIDLRNGRRDVLDWAGDLKFTATG